MKLGREYFKVIEEKDIIENKLFDTSNCNYYHNQLHINNYYFYDNFLKDICNLGNIYNYGLDLFMIMYESIHYNDFDINEFTTNNIPLIRLTYNDEYKPDERIELETLKEIYSYIKNMKIYPLNLSLGTYLCEYIFEKERQKNFSNFPSRLKSYFVFDSIKDCEYYIHTHCQDKKIVTIIPETINVFFKSDIKLIDTKKMNTTMNEYINIANNYWKNNYTTDPIMEYFFQGTFKMKKI